MPSEPGEYERQSVWARIVPFTVTLVLLAHIGGHARYRVLDIGLVSVRRTVAADRSSQYRGCPLTVDGGQSCIRRVRRHTSTLARTTGPAHTRREQDRGSGQGPNPTGMSRLVLWLRKGQSSAAPRPSTAFDERPIPAVRSIGGMMRQSSSSAHIHRVPRDSGPSGLGAAGHRADRVGS